MYLFSNLGRNWANWSIIIIILHIVAFLLSHISNQIIHLFFTFYFLFLNSYSPYFSKKKKKLLFFLLVRIYYFTFFNFFPPSLSLYYSLFYIFISLYFLFYCYTLSFSLSYILTIPLLQCHSLYSIHILSTKNYEYLLSDDFLFNYVFWYIYFFTKSFLSLL